MSLYNIVKIIPFNELSNKILKRLSNAAVVAEKSDFNSSKRLGASLQYKRAYFLQSNNHRRRAGKIDCGQSLHAEVNVILQALKSCKKNTSLKSKMKLPSSTVYVVRLMNENDNLPEYRSFRFGISKPCNNCEKQLHKFNVTKVFYIDVIDGQEVLCEMRMK